MLKNRIIPVLQWDGLQAVKTTQFRRPGRPVGSMMQHILNMQRRDVDELIILDINATKEGRPPAYDKVSEYASELYCPLTVGGGITKLDQIKELLNSGADKVAIKSGWELIPKAIEKFGAQCIVGVIDYSLNGKFLKHQSKGSFLDVGEVLLTCIDKEGTRTGYDLEFLPSVREHYKCPIVINGGCRSPCDMLEAHMAGADAFASSSMFLFTDITPKDCARFLNDKNVPVRL